MHPINRIVLHAISCTLVASAVTAQNWPDVPTLQLGRECAVGVDDGRPEEVFGFIGGAAFDSVGNMFVLDRQERVVRVYSPTCRHLRSFGRAGSGPGEFSSNPLGIRVESGRVYVSHSGSTFGERDSESRGRSSVFDVTGRYLAGERAKTGLCCGARVTAIMASITSATRQPPPATVVLEHEGRSQVLAQGSSGIALAVAQGGASRAIGRYGFRYLPRTLTDTLFVLADGYEGVLRFYSITPARLTPRVVRTVSLGVQGSILTAANQRQLQETARRLAGSRATAISPERWSLVERMWHDDARIWLQSADPTFWTVVALHDNGVAHYRMPAGIRVVAISDTHMLGVTETSNGSHVLNRYRLPARLPK